MPEDASLDQFVSSGKTDESETDDSADSESVEPESTAPETSEDSAEQFEKSATESAEEPSVEPAVSTFTWSSVGGECADCGASAERRWRADGQKDGGLVCADCKEW